MLTVYSSCISTISQTINRQYVILCLTEVLIASVILPYFTICANSYLVTGQVTLAIRYYTIYLLLNETNDRIFKKILNNANLEVDKNMSLFLEKHIIDTVYKYPYDDIQRLLEKQLGNKINSAKWSLLTFCNNVITTSITYTAMIAYFIAIFQISPITFVMYVIAIILGIISNNENEKEKEDYTDIWKRYDFHWANLFNSAIHNNYDKCIGKMVECMKEFFDLYNKKKKEKQEKSDYLTFMVNIAFGISINFVVSGSDAGTILNFIYYSTMITSQCYTIKTLIVSYKTTKIDLEKLTSLLPEKKRNVNKQITTFSSITIESLKFCYPNSYFILQTKGEIQFRSGTVTYLKGASGHGKSTFMKILTGITPNFKFISKIKLDGHIHEAAMEKIISKRVYVRQRAVQDIDWNSSIFSIVTGETKNDSNVVSYTITHALDLSLCSDFVDIHGVGLESLRDIYVSDKEMSGGQQGRILIAKALYEVFISDAKLIVLDEIDGAVETEKVVKLMGNLYTYARTNDKILVVSAHNPYVQKMQYDQVIEFVNGNINIIS